MALLKEGAAERNVKLSNLLSHDCKAKKVAGACAPRWPSEKVGAGIEAAKRHLMKRLVVLVAVTKAPCKARARRFLVLDRISSTWPRCTVALLDW